MVRIDEILRLLVIESSLTDADTMITRLRQAGLTIRASRLDDAAAIQEAITTQTWDMVLARDENAALSATEVLELITMAGRDLPCIIIASENAELAPFYDTHAVDVVSVTDMERLPFAVIREINNLFIRRLSRRNERALRESEKRAQFLLQTSRDAVAYVHEGMFIHVNDSYLQMFGYDDEDDVAGLSILDMVVADHHARFKTAFREFSEQDETSSQSVEIRCQRVDGSEFNASVAFSHAEVEGEHCTQLVVREKATDTLSPSPGQSADGIKDIDPLTQLYNRVRLIEELEKAIKKADEQHQSSELLYLVIDDFKKIKEQIGLSASDIVLKGVADLLKSKLQDDEFLAYYANQVFVIIIDSRDSQHVDERAEYFRQVIDDYVSSVNGKIFNLQCSIGISRITENLSAPAVALDRADKACMQAQQAGGNKVVRYQPVASELSLVQEESSEDIHFWQERINECVKHDNFILYYQPIVSLHGPEQEFYDVVVRIQDGEHLIKADEFIHFIQDTDAMITLDEWVIPHALRSLAQHKVQFPKTRFFIKLSRQTVFKPNIIDWLHKEMQANGIQGRDLVFEVSEALTLKNLDQAKAIVTQLKMLGCEFCLEHFGTGLDFSQSLNALDVDYLKINGDFVENMARDAENQAAVKAIIDMCKQAGKRSIAEFVSDANSLALLWRLGVDYASGYYIQEPGPELDYNFEDDNL